MEDLKIFKPIKASVFCMIFIQYWLCGLFHVFSYFLEIIDCTKILHSSLKIMK